MQVKSLILAVGLSLGASAQAHTLPVYQAGVDLEFSCASHSGSRETCTPHHNHYKRYMHLANWRFVGEGSMPGSCRLGSTYGYEPQGVWVSGNCVAFFRAPDLRYGDRYNAQRVPGAPLGGR